MIKLKLYRQKPGFCGPASMKMVLELYGVKKSEDELGRMTKCSPVVGTPGPNIVAAAKKLGFKAFLKDEATLSDVRKWTEKGIPVIVNWFSEYEGHYSVAVKVTEKFIYLMDPERTRMRKMSAERFEGVWFDFTPESRRTRRSLVLRRMIVIHPK